jgi:hypothetical protein
MAFSSLHLYSFLHQHDFLLSARVPFLHQLCFLIFFNSTPFLYNHNFLSSAILSPLFNSVTVFY